MLTILIRKETLRQLAELDEGDILIRPNLGEYASTNFDDILDVVAPGQAAAVGVAARLSDYALNESEYRALAAARQGREDESGNIAFIRVIDAGPLSADALKERLLTRVGDPIDVERLAAEPSSETV